MDNATRVQRVKEFNDIMERALVKYQDVIGPQVCEEHGYQVEDCDDDVCNWEPTGALLRTWCLTFGWELAEGPGTGSGMPDYFMPEGAMSWETVGLLQHVLDDIRGITA